MKQLTLLLLLIIAQATQGQSLSVFDVDASNFPTMRAKFFAFDAAGNQIKNLSPTDFKVTENGTPRTVKTVSCPNSIPVAVSSVLVFDMSGSMRYGPPRIESAKNAANAWVDGLPLGKSECALVSFDDQSMILHDFTKDRAKLKNSIALLKPDGGTDYDQALIDEPSGGLQIAKTGKNKKVLIFLTDGQPNSEPRTQEIIALAKQYSITIYAVTLDMPAPQCIKDMTKQTGGQYFENITTLKDAEETYQKLLQLATNVEPCEITWESGVSCTAGITNVELEIANMGITDNTSYVTPITALAKLEFNPPFIRFANPTPGEYAPTQTVTVTAHNADFTINDIITKIPVGFEINPKNFPIPLKAGQSMEFTVTYFPADSGYNNCRFDVESEPCPTKFYVSGGWKGKKPTVRTIKLIHPNGGETFVAGSDTIITWEGVSPDEPVKLEYRTDDDQSWVTITDAAKGLSYPFRVPIIASKKYLARVTVKSDTLDNELVLIPAGKFRMGNTGAFSDDDNEQPIHTVTISRDFLMSKYEITQKHYEAVMGTNPSYFKGENLPVEQVSWYDAVAFCNKLSELEGLEQCYSIDGKYVTCNLVADGYRLPTEAEWEFACKAGTTTDFYNGSLTSSGCIPLDTNLDKIGWYCGNTSSRTQEVGQKEPNAFGLYDMIGNVSEWCWDWFLYYSSLAVTDPISTLPSGVDQRVYRGSSCYDWGSYCRSSERSYNDPNHRFRSKGFRIVSTR